MRLPWTIWRHVLAETWRLVLLTAAVLVTVTAFAVTIRYTADGKLGPLDTLKFMGLAMVPMLQYVLPFAGGFGATLAYHRMSQDNELTAASAGGVGHRAMLVPAVVTGLVLAGGLALLNGTVIPRFLRSMEQMIAQDAPRLIARTIDSGQPFQAGSWMVHADRVYQLPTPRRTADSPYDLLVLSRVAAIETDPAGAVVREITAGQATAAFFAGREADGEGGEGGLTHVVLELKNAAPWDKLTRGQGGALTMYFPIQGVFNDDPKYHTNAELRQIPGDPDRLNIIDSRRRDLAYAIAERETISTIEASLRAQGRVRLTDPTGRTFSIQAAGLRASAGDDGKERWELLPPAPSSPIGVDLYAAGQGGAPDPADRIRFSAPTAGLRSAVSRDPASRRLTLTLEMEQVAAQAREGDPAGRRTSLSYPGLSPAGNPLPELLAKNSAALLAEADARAAGGADAGIGGPAHTLRDRIARLHREVLSKLHERWAMAAACLVMVAAGAVTAMRLGGSLPLTVYLWSFFPALACVITVSMGQNVTHSAGAAGLVVLWGGVAVLAVYAAWAFRLVRRH